MLYGKHSLLKIRIIRIISIHSISKIQNFALPLMIHSAVKIKNELKFHHKVKHTKFNSPSF